MIMDAYQENTKCSEKKREREEGLRTVECLRGRLLAERQASRVAKEEAELMNKKIAELEAHLKEEINLREKAEKKLKFLMKKLESLKLSCNSEGSEQSTSSEVSAVSSASSTGTSASREEEDQEAKTRIINPEETHDHGVVEKIKPDQANAKVPSMEENSSSTLKDLSSGEVSVASTTSHEEPKTVNSSSTADFNVDKESEKDDNKDLDGNSWALVAVEVPQPRRDNKEPKIEDKSVVEVLDALREARERVQRSVFERRRKQMIRVGTHQNSYITC